ncbi:hypothetical protein ACUUMA_03375 [Paenarthrobacter nitroguajacolicus]
MKWPRVEHDEACSAGFGMESVMLKKLMCKLNLGHDWHAEHTEDGSRYLRCRRCGKYDDGGDPGGGHATILDMGG